MPTGISYADETWNPVVGCKIKSEGCQKCWAATFASRELCDQHKGLTYLDATGRRRWNGRVNTVPDALDKPFSWRDPKIVLTPSMSDYFYDGVPWPLVTASFRVMESTPKHTYLVLTKRLEGRALAYLLRQKPIPNVVIGVTVESQPRADERLVLLARLAMAGWRTWISVEPMLSRVWLRSIPANLKPPVGLVDGDDYFCALTGAGHEPQSDTWGSTDPRWSSNPAGTYGSVEYVVVGGESGSGARPCSINWVRSVVHQCRRAGVKVHLKQLGTNRDWPRGWKLKSRTGGDPEEWPHDLRVREMVR